jgi:AcrR family transcriptional regulator
MRPNKRDELVRNALEIFYRNGFHATGMDMLVRETGVSKTSMYKHFRNKDELILAVLRLRDEHFRNWLYRRIEETADTPGEQLLALFDVLKEWFALPGFRGCMFIKASAEFQEPQHPIYVQAAEHKRMLGEYFSALAMKAGAENPRDLSAQLMLLKEGAIVLAAMGVNRESADDAKKAAQVLLAGHIASWVPPMPS